jgi:nitroreductase
MLPKPHHPTRSPVSSSPIALPRPKLGAGKSLPEALRLRRTTREISARKLPLQVLSNLLWAACGVNRSNGPFDGPGITAASASNSQEVQLYVLTKDGAYLFDAVGHRLLPVVASDLRALAISWGQREMVTAAPVQLVYVADIQRLVNTTGFQEPGLHDPEVQKSYYYVATGLIAGNIYLFAAAQGLAAWFHNCDRAGLAKKLKLRPEQRVLFGQTVGYPGRAFTGAPPPSRPVPRASPSA